MESSYRIIKGNHAEADANDKFLINTEIENIEKEEDEERFIEEEVLEFDIDYEEKIKIIEDLKEYKRRMNLQMEYEKKNILESALIEAEKEAIGIRAAAEKEGYKEGFARAIAAAKEEAQEIKNDALDMLKTAKENRDSYLKENQAKIYDLAAAMAENIINFSIDADDENIIKLMEPLLEEYLKEEDITISTTKEGKDLLIKHKASLEKICPNTRFIFLVDKSLEKNGFVIENKESIVDLSISLQLENMIKAISDSNG